MRITTPLVIVFALGAAVAAAVQQFTPTGWWLNSLAGVQLTNTTFLILAAVVAFAVRLQRRSALVAMMALWGGVMTGMAVILFIHGAGSIFPIVLIIAGACRE